LFPLSIDIDVGDIVFIEFSVKKFQISFRRMSEVAFIILSLRDLVCSKQQ